MPRDMEKKLNAEDKCMCYDYKARQIFKFIWSFLITTRNAEDMESQSLEHLATNWF